MKLTDSYASLDHYSSLVQLLDEAMNTNRDRVALVSLGVQLTYGELDRLSLAWAAWLQSEGIKPGDRVAIMLPNMLASPVTLIGTLRAGCVVVNVNPLYTARELQSQLRDSRPDVIVLFEAFAATLQQVPASDRPGRVVLAAAGDLMPRLKGGLVNFVVRHVQRKVPAWKLDGASRLPEVLKLGANASFTPVQITPEHLAFLQYTGGTTGEPRAAMLSHRNVIANILQVHEIAQPALGDLLPKPLTMLTALPLYHVFAMTVCELYALYAGMRIVLVINPRDLKALTKIWRTERPHIFPAVNTLFAALLRHEPFKQLDFSNLRISLGGGMAIHQPVAEQWQRLTGRTIVEGYGMSETSPVICANRTDATSFTGTVGFPLPGTEVKILDDDRQPVADGQPGEIAVRGPQVMLGYWQAPEATSQAMTADGYLLTGDIGVREPSGQVRIVDRKKDMILVSGFNVYPAEIDAVFASHPDVTECAAVGVPDGEGGEAIKLFVVPAKSNVDTTAMQAWARERLTGYKRPREIVLVQSLPKNTVGKTLRRMLRDQ
ncbi:AMP-binding protein [Orrella daihaiensis]|nr:AMP-binding protein [Orrella daihaiensis]